VVGRGLNISNILDLIGTGGIVALLLFIIGSLVVGFLLGGREHGSVLGLGTAQRNVSAALVVAAQNFAAPGSMTLPYVLVGAILMLLILMPTAKRLGARAASAGNGVVTPVETSVPVA